MSALIDKLRATQNMTSLDKVICDQLISNELVTRLRKQSEKNREFVESEIRRICRLPIIELLSPEEVEEFSRQFITAEQFEKGFRLFDTQANAILSYKIFNGLFAPIGVGWGKTLITICIANEAFKKGIQKILLCVPPQVYPQLVYTDIPWTRQRTNIVVPFIYLGNKTQARRKILTIDEKPGCYILPYSLLSVKDTSEIIQRISPKLFILDEAHLLKNRDAARTKRVVNYLMANKPEVVALSGTVTNKSVRDYHHLIKACLKENCPLPLEVKQALDWGCVIDSNAAPSSGQTGPVKPLIQWGIQNFPEEDFTFDVTGFRKAYKKRLHTCPGVVATGDSIVGCSLIIENIPAEIAPNEELKKHIKGVLEEWVTPDGDEIDHAIHTYKWLYELSAGFYNSLFWPETQEYAFRKGISETQAETLLIQAKEHHKRNQEYKSELREFLKHSFKEGLDTPMLVAHDMSKHGDDNVPESLYDAWRQVKELERPDLPERDSEPIRVCDYKISAANKWAWDIGEGGIIWVYHQEIGKWMYERLKESLIECIHCPRDTDELILNPKYRDHIMVASITAHGVGKNLQHFHNQYFLQWPRSAATAEQALGRLHRSGQEADEVLAVTNTTTDFDKLNFAACLNDSLYIHQSTGAKQKLIYATYSPDSPEIFPSEVLRERGLQPDLLSPEYFKILQDRFRKENSDTTE